MIQVVGIAIREKMKNSKTLPIFIILLMIPACDETANPSIHPDEWIIQGAENSHMAKIEASGVQTCSVCHGKDYYGGSSGISCNQCHAGGSSGHPEFFAWISPDSSDYHGRIFWENGWDFTDCQKCHGDDFAGGVTGSSCNTCHTSGIGSCTTCHGDAVSGVAYPPKDIYNNTDPSLITVGAHRVHMESEISTVNCDECHQVPTNYLDNGHLDSDNIAEVIFGSVATDSSVLSPTWDRSNTSCSNIYCHGAFSFSYGDSLITGNNSSVIWTDYESAECGTCHGLPPDGHTGTWTKQQCFICHSTVLDANGIIIDKTKHINGQVDLN
ncbi:MAG: CxxxxCH/CxxCH domain-containing protein [Candidatus Marinimicrobia bacterium]|jgi:predicted CxxxxCH...CXXCH cytochrome family protein|nr:CxxxxCH/CxxCH domain-containing protein [Candidatus Neomarinimicrobiota bacterium]MBT4280518.1 CxxxxCH/CxxCH domain-containing protein [Candidatus Neomarinimicrobiota bacterium]MBT4795112.1 CxxxxCH/CxxCH domain-containing protein [Candidatus Neomarinimicrobiota bacterium]MBT5340084.1 CxxxxCH/CxxCH domain-containing protein [Candidatus Neomarinimicrobiota bacterium]MBT6001058.1 CxxxxCH/CxxCH domain-containing protein [Candidatus Neomarinimicrobiota bacterium]